MQSVFCSCNVRYIHSAYELILRKSDTLELAINFFFQTATFIVLLPVKEALVCRPHKASRRGSFCSIIHVDNVRDVTGMNPVPQALHLELWFPYQFLGNALESIKQLHGQHIHQLLCRWSCTPCLSNMHILLTRLCWTAFDIEL